MGYEGDQDGINNALGVNDKRILNVKMKQAMSPHTFSILSVTIFFDVASISFHIPGGEIRTPVGGTSKVFLCTEEYVPLL